MEVKSKVKFTESTRTKKLINFESESAASSLVGEMYTSLKKQKPTVLSPEQLAWVEKVERLYGKNKSSEANIICEALNNAYHYLNGTSKWNEVDNKLHEMLEKIIFLRAKHLSLNTFLDGIETTIRSTLSLDFSNKASLIDPEIDKRNILNYATFALNMLIEKIETSMVSMKAVNRMLAAPPHSALVITNTKGAIRFINTFGEALFALKRDDLIQKHIHSLFKDPAAIQHFIENRTVDITTLNVEVVVEKQTIPVFLTASTITSEDEEIEECIFVIKTNEEVVNENDNTAYSLQNEEEKEKSLHSISEMLQLLKSKSNYNAPKPLLSFLEESLNIIKKDVQRNNYSVIRNNTEFFIQDPVNIEFIYDSIIEGLSFVEGYNEVTFEKNIVHKNDFYSNSILIYSILQKLITAAIKLRDTNFDNKIQFTVRNFSDANLLLILQFSSGTISDTDIRQLLEKNTRNIFNIEANDTQLISVEEAIHRLKGTIETYISPSKHVVFTISLPY